MATFVVINVQHQIMPDQIRALNEMFGDDWSRLNVPADGWSAEQQIAELSEVGDATLVFASPIPLMLMLSERRVNGETRVFHNDKREKKEFPQKDGPAKVVFTVAETGWKIL